jgi:hypothetical protein
MKKSDIMKKSRYSKILRDGIDSSFRMPMRALCTDPDEPHVF